MRAPTVAGRLTRALAALALVAGISGAALPVRGAEPIKVALIPVDPAADAWYAQDRGYFKKAGLDVQLEPMPSGPAIAQALLGGAVDIGVANVATIAAAHERGIDLKFIAPAAVTDEKTMTDVIMVPIDSKAKSGADLNGKTVAINGLKDLQQLEAMGWIDKHGGNSKTVRFVEVKVPEMGAALQSHRVDAALTIEPFVTASKSYGKVIGVAPQGVANRLMLVGWFASEKWLAAHPAEAAKFASAIREANAWANAHQKESAAILTGNTKLSPALASTMARSTYGINLDPAVIQPVLDAALKYGVIAKPLAAAELIWRAPAASSSR